MNEFQFNFRNNTVPTLGSNEAQQGAAASMLNAPIEKQRGKNPSYFRWQDVDQNNYPGNYIYGTPEAPYTKPTTVAGNEQPMMADNEMGTIGNHQMNNLKTRLDNLENEKADIEKRIPQLEAALEDMKRSQADRLAENRMSRWRKDNTGMDQWNKNRDRETEIELRNITDTRTLRNNLTKSLDDIDANIAYWNQQKVAGDSATKAAADAELVRLNERKKSLLKLGKDKGLDLSEYYSGGSSEPEDSTPPTPPESTTTPPEPEDIFKGKSEWEIANTASEGQTETNVQRIAQAKKEIERLEGIARNTKKLTPELSNMGYRIEKRTYNANKGKTDEYGFELKPLYKSYDVIIKPNGKELK